MRLLQCLLHCRRLMLKPESGYCTTRREARGTRRGQQRSAKRSARRGAKRRARRRAKRKAKRKKRDARRSAKRRAERSMERSTKRSEKRRTRRSTRRRAHLLSLLLFVFRFTFQIYVYPSHFSFEFHIVFPFLHVRFIFLVQIYDLNVWFLASAFSLLKPGGTLKRVLGECSCADLALVAILFVGF